MQHKIITLIALCITTIGFAQTTTDFFKASDAFFSEHVIDGKINYKAIKENPAQLEKILASTNTITVSKSDANT